MAITAEQAAQLASTYQAGDTSGLQGLVSSMGVTAGDVAQYFPGFDVGSLQGITLAPSAPAAPAIPAPTYGTDKFTAQQVKDYVAANIGDPGAISRAATQQGITQQNLADIFKGTYAPEQIGQYLSSPAATLYGPEKFTAKEIRDYVAANIADPTRIYQAAQQYKVTPENLSTIYAGTETPYGLDQIQQFFKTGQTGFQPRFQELVSQTLGTTDEQAALEKAMGLKTGELSQTALDPTRFASTSIENIEKSLQESQANRYQEALRAANIMQNIYDVDKDKALSTAKNLYQNKDTDAKTQELYDQLLKTGLTQDTQTAILQDAATRAPQSKFFKENPNALAIYSPVGAVKSNPEGSGQYGLDPATKLPFMHRGETDKMLGNEVILGGVGDVFRQNLGQDTTGLDPHSAWAGRVAKGVGVFGVSANKNDIDYFDKIEKEINRLGGIKREADPEGGTYEAVYVQRKDPDTGATYTTPVPIQNLFAKPSDDGQEAYDRYKLYRDTQDRMREAASSIGIDPTKYQTTKQAYDDLNTKLKDAYLWQGRTDVLDPAAAKALGIEDVKDNQKHATILYRAVGDKLVPQKVVRTFDFKDPNTTRGFFGDIISGIAEIMSVPPIAIAFSMAGGIPALLQGTLGTAAASTAASTMASAIGSSLNSTLNLGLQEAGQELLGRALLNAGTSGLMTGAATGDLDKAGISALSSLAGTGVAGLSEPYIGKALSQVAGGAASKAVTGADLQDYLKGQLFGTGISALMGQTGQSQTGDLLKAFAPIIMSGKVNPEDLIRLSQAIKQPQPARVS